MKITRRKPIVIALSIFFIFLVLMTIVTLIALKNADKIEDNKEVWGTEIKIVDGSDWPRDYLMFAKPIKIHPGTNYNMTINGSTEEYVMITQLIIFNLSKLDINEATKVDWVIDNRTVSNDPEYYHQYHFEPSYVPSNSTIELIVYKDTTIEKYVTVLTFNFISYFGPDGSWFDDEN